MPDNERKPEDLSFEDAMDSLESIVSSLETERLPLADMVSAYERGVKLLRTCRDRIATAIRLRLQLADRECVRRGAALFAFPQHVTAGSRALWATADTIWTALGDTSNDLGWYTKRVSVSGVYAATLLFWLGDDSTDQLATWQFLDRRIENVMSFEKTKARFRENPMGKALMAGPLKILERIHAPKRANDLPGKL